jgi:hypothetical protein
MLHTKKKMTQPGIEPGSTEQDFLAILLEADAHQGPLDLICLLSTVIKWAINWDSELRTKNHGFKIC